MDIEAYLVRIGYDGSCEPTAETLRALHRAHLFAVPFENLDIHLGIPIELALPALHDKIAFRRRGGFCYELNGLFAWLLGRLGFEVTQLSGRVFHGGQPGSEFDHMVLHVELQESWIVDVGFGDSFLEPFPAADVEHQEPGGSYRVRVSESEHVLERRAETGDWTPQYAYTCVPRRLEEFAAMCLHQQTSPESVFRRKVICSRATPQGRVTLANDRLIVTTRAGRDERPVAGAEDFRALLVEHFEIALAADQRVERLLLPAAPH